MDKKVVTGCSNCPLVILGDNYKCSHPKKGKNNDVTNQVTFGAIAKSCPLRINDLIIELYKD